VSRAALPHEIALSSVIFAQSSLGDTMCDVAEAGTCAGIGMTVRTLERERKSYWLWKPRMSPERGRTDATTPSEVECLTEAAHGTILAAGARSQNFSVVP
jgi:hypothetical protein